MIALGANALFLVVELAGGFAFGSLALLADATHMVSDVAALAMAYAALVLAQRPPTTRHTYGLARTEVLVAQANGVLLIAGAVAVVIESVRRLGSPHHVDAAGVLVVGVLGLGVNLGSALILRPHAHDSMGVRGALWHLAADALGSIAVIISAIGVVLWGADRLDPIASLFIAALVLFGAFQLLRDATRVLLEAVPAGLDADAVRDALCAEPGVEAVHHLHLWTIGSAHAALSAHVVLGGELSLHDAQERGGELKELLSQRFGIEHATLEVECHACVDEEHIHHA
ncbi:MAG TPA: cation diffusion facilitator family transporter [Acidimicrobiia bacterium]|nr:cation diffusion facilitator family transporter [Acidimicrobiia bacterium]